jgi:hypothetical protein
MRSGGRAARLGPAKPVRTVRLRPRPPPQAGGSGDHCRLQIGECRDRHPDGLPTRSPRKVKSASAGARLENGACPKRTWGSRPPPSATAGVWANWQVTALLRRRMKVRLLPLQPTLDFGPRGTTLRHTMRHTTTLANRHVAVIAAGATVVDTGSGTGTSAVGTRPCGSIS